MQTHSSIIINFRNTFINNFIIDILHYARRIYNTFKNERRITGVKYITRCIHLLCYLHLYTWHEAAPCDDFFLFCVPSLPIWWYKSWSVSSILELIVTLLPFVWTISFKSDILLFIFVIIVSFFQYHEIVLMNTTLHQTTLFQLILIMNFVFTIFKMNHHFSLIIKK